jgi:hypothetical protein
LTFDKKIEMQVREFVVRRNRLGVVYWVPECLEELRDLEAQLECPGERGVLSTEDEVLEGVLVPCLENQIPHQTRWQSTM